MAERNWTTEQRNAINSRGGTLLLSAAAGSGKTAVLVERITKLMTTGNEPVDPANLLVVTFTNAAAAEMRARVNDSIDKLIKQNPADAFLRSIKMKLPEAKITTMDSFCISFVREHFHMADIEPDFNILDNSEINILTYDAMSTTLERICREEPELYDKLNTVTSFGRDDNSLTEKIIRLYNYSLSHPFPDKWLDSIMQMYEDNGDIRDTVWGKIILDEVRYTAHYCLSLIENALAEMREDDVVNDTYSAFFTVILSKLTDTYNTITEGDWDSIFHALDDITMGSLPRAPRGYGKNPTKLLAESQYNLARKLMNECKASVCTDTSGHRDDLDKLRPVMRGLISAVREFRMNYDNLKQARNSYTFTDIMHKALSLLAVNDNGEIRKTDLAIQMSEMFREILIDEYQDTNEAQDMLFATLSRKNSNMFMVGDVKQSIYRFRLAMPEIFVKKSREYCDFDNESYPAKIILGRNFRSRKGVLDNINFLFKNIMSDYVGEMEYTDADALYYGDTYDKDTVPAAELHMVNTKSTADEAEYIARFIRKTVAEGAVVKTSDGTRPAGYGDFCILLRSTAGKTDIFEEALKRNSIPVTCEKKSGLFSASETAVFMSLLKIINNPTDDVALLSVMFSPLYGFTADDTAKIRLYGKRCNLYTCLKDASADIKKASVLLEDINRFRYMAAIMPTDTFVRTLLDTTGYLSIVSACENGESRRLNLLLLCSLATDYTSKGGSGLGGFIRYLDRISESGNDIAAASDASADSSAVKIMSIHKSKGLEFPFVILADCSKTFNTTDISAEMIISTSAGVGMKITDSPNLKRYSSLGHTASKLAVKRATASEEMRILYVAMTRAKERFIAVGSVQKPEERLRDAANSLSGEKPSPCAVLHASSYMKWLLMGFIRHPDMKKICEETGNFVLHDYKNADSRLKVLVTSLTEDEDEAMPEETALQQAEYDEETVEEIKKRVSYEYPFVIPADARPKRAASDFEKKHFNAEYFATSKPTFMSEGKLSAAEAGTANHLFLQNLDFSSDDVNGQLEEMVRKGILGEKEADAIRINKVKKFLTSPLCARIRKADSVMREKEFTVRISLGDIDKTVNDNVKDEKIIILGKADLVFIENNEAVVVDWKTDRGKTPEDFVNAYSGQLDMYRRAMEIVLGIPVKETLIYSLDLEKAITCEEK